MTLRNKRLKLMRGGVWRGHIRNVSGNPVTLENALGLQTLEVTGNSVQDGTPSPDNPVEVVGVGERTLNLFNAALHPKIVRGGYLTNTAALAGTPLKIPVDAGKTYTIYRKNARAMNRDFYFRAIRFEDNNGLIIRVDTKAKPNNTIFYGTYDGDYFAAAKFTVPDGAAILRVGCLPNTADALQKLCDEIMLVEGEYTADTLPPYEPYGYKIPVSATGKNLFNANKIKYYGYIRYDGYDMAGRKWDELPTTQNNAQFGVTEPLPIQPNKQYTISNFSTSNDPGFCFLAEDKETIINGDTSKDKSFLSPENAHWIVISINLDNLNVAQLELGNIATGYEPYKEPQTLNVFTSQILHGLGNTSDTVTIDFGNRRAELTKRYEYFKVNTPDWSAGHDSYDSAITTNRNHSYTEVYEGRNSINDSKCNVLPKYNGVLWNTDEQGFTWNVFQLHLRINNSVLGITLDDTREERTAKFKAYIQNNDIYVLGKLATPTTTDISDLQDWDNMPDISGTIILTANSTAEPTLNVNYYSTVKE